MWELPTDIENPDKADSLVRLLPCPGNLTQWGKVSAAGEHYSEPASSVCSLSPSGIASSSVTALGMQLAFHATACSHLPLLPTLVQAEICA